ncbi:PREDICTED: probable acyl-[acyl-carrier-protein]--UDP-N-acetylglucosamine O-acyltransferase, mitochondrial isoform X2 [Populus euphratica]|uniref:Probable acyl-[acyl-carrier-protein]--UDP-N-acetylglucosamine O-acyltransferase, mitochondrial isoform X2 n=1 Tax=Populus euphratica TaxID=75702 RepID=A0AAJ6TH33_POPEU|nr:PREDICTED: probable acyl-[acyl-carrier-protein]--UDP-N-acetylglucosamine O-acyltransferase, mitochondrial isoform X2 [Populus euphratica]
MAAATNSILLKLKPNIKTKICNPLFGFARSSSSASPSIPHLFSATALPYADADSDCSSEIKATADANPNLIHPSADVHPNAVIGHGVSVGPFCTIGSSVKLGNGCRLYPGSHVFGDTEIGDHCLLMPGAVVGDHLPGRTVLGCNNVIGHHAVIGVKCQDLKYKPGDECFLHIGDNNEIREHTSIHRSSKSSDKTVIGDNNLIMGSCHIAHDCNIGNNNIFANNTLLAGHAVVEVSQDVPKYTMVVGERAELRGLNLEGLRRNGFTATEIKSLRTAYRNIFMPVDSNSTSFEERITKVEEDKELGKIPAVCSMIQSLRDSFAQNRRGICKFRYFSGS